MTRFDESRKEGLGIRQEMLLRVLLGENYRITKEVLLTILSVYVIVIIVVFYRKDYWMYASSDSEKIFLCVHLVVDLWLELQSYQHQCLFLS